MFTLYLNRLDLTLAQPLVRVSLALVWVRLTNSHCYKGKRIAMVGVFVLFDPLLNHTIPT